jgi:hypothetical protein
MHKLNRWIHYIPRSPIIFCLSGPNILFKAQLKNKLNLMPNDDRQYITPKQNKK